MSVARVALTPEYDESLTHPANLTTQDDMGSSEPIMICLTIDGSVVPMRILESDSIASVKLRIQASQGFFVKKQKLVFEGRELARNNSCVRDYGVSDGNVLHLVLRLSDLLAITVRTVCGKELEFHIERSRNVGYVKQQIAKKGKGFLDFKNQELICDGEDEELEDQRLINDICKKSDAGVIHLVVRKSAKVRAKPIQKDFEISIEASNFRQNRTNLQTEYHWGTKLAEGQIIESKQLQKDFLLEPLVVNTEVALSLVIKKLISSTCNGMERGYEPIRSTDGTGGAYFMQDSSGLNYVSVFKPIDEEPMAVNNPRHLPLSLDGEGLKKGTRVGGGALREVAAYLLDHPRDRRRTFNSEKGYAGVPPTVMVKCSHKGFNHPEGDPKNVKVGSLQMFVENDGSCEDMGPRDFPVDDVHKISVLDIRLANADRHAGNILVHKDTDGGRIVLVPIDHGYCLPESVSTKHIFKCLNLYFCAMLFKPKNSIPLF